MIVVGIGVDVVGVDYGLKLGGSFASVDSTRIAWVV